MNSLDSAFCRRCGVALDEADVQVAREKLVKLLEKGGIAFNEGRIEEALEISETALASDPNSTVGLTLKMNCLERRDRIAEALECAERIVELSPDSELDKIKRNQLRRLLEATARENEPANRRIARVGAVSAFVLFATLGSYAAYMTRKSQERDLIAKNERPRVETPTQTDVRPPSNPPANPTTATPQGAQPGTGVTQPTTNQVQAPPQQTTFPPVKGPRVQEEDPGQLPNPLNGNISVRPVNPPSPNVNGAGNTVTPAKPNPDVKTSKEPDEPQPDKPSTPPKPQGTIDITVHTGGHAPTTVPDASDGNGLQALIKTAASQFQSQNYPAAARAYERALSSGGDAMSLCERLGQCYEQMGKKNEAISAYSRGLRACQDALAAGRGDKDRIQRKADLYRSRLQVVGG